MSVAAVLREDELALVRLSGSLAGDLIHERVLLLVDHTLLATVVEIGRVLVVSRLHVVGAAKVVELDVGELVVLVVVQSVVS